MPKILVVDDDRAIRESTAFALEMAGHRVWSAANAEEARAIIAKERVEVVVSDIYMPGEDGIDLLRSMASRKHAPAVILMTARGSIETATVAARIGAFDYLAKPFDVADLVGRVAAAVAPKVSAEALEVIAPQSMIVGAHPTMVAIYKAITRIASVNVPVLIHGESGTGKELVARAIHIFGGRSEGPFVAINCGAIPDTLLESELFGTVRGAYTDARHDRRGVLARADGGTVFLDEIGDTSPSFQVKLLRFLQDGIITPLGSEKSLELDVRVISATHRSIRSLVTEGKFREDLFFRLAGYEIDIPPLRERTNDIPLLVEAFRRRVTTELGRESVGGATPDVLALLSQHRWPGNVRELEQAVRRIIIDCGSLGDAATASRVLDSLTDRNAQPLRQQATANGTDDSPAPMTSLDEAERQHIVSVLQATGGNQRKAAFILGIERNTLARKIKKYGIPISRD